MLRPKASSNMIGGAVAGTRRPRVALIGTGGTISAIGAGPLDFLEYGWSGRILEPDALLARFPDVSAEADVVPVRFRALPSNAITEQDWMALLACIDGLSPSEFEGIVLTHGTATLEETAYFLNLTVTSPLPVVVVGAQRPPSALSSDAGLNLLNAVRVAADPRSRGRGVLVLLNDVVHAARDVTKSSNHRLEAFQSDPGVLGHADEDGRIVYYRMPERRGAPQAPFDIRGLDRLPRVDIAYSYAFSDGAAIRAFVEAGARAVVCASLPPGFLTPDEWDAARKARARGVVVVMSSRAGRGRMLLGAPQREAGLVAADNLTAQKARILAMLALTLTDDTARIQSLFDTC